MHSVCYIMEETASGKESHTMKRNIRLLLEYDGSRYQGWQRLGKSSVSTTIQGKLEGVLSRMTGEDIQVTGSGRTDAGVHARGQVANFHTDCTLSCREIRDYLTAYLPQDIGVREVTEAKERFHSRLNATSKTYLYRLGLPGYSHVFSRKYIWLLPETPDISRMQKAAALLEGTHDFQGFSSAKKTKKSTVRELYSVTVEQKGPEIHILYQGNGFLYNMVRILTGTLVETGLGQREPEQILAVFSSRDRADAGMTAPPQGLCLMEVTYD